MMTFGPNCRGLISGRYMHHRGNAFHSLMEQVTDLFRSAFSVPDDWDILFLTGSGTMANEALIYSFCRPIAVANPGGHFASRLVRIAQAQGKYDPRASDVFYVAYETYACQHFDVPELAGRMAGRSIRVADMVSAFPYYAPDWDHLDAFTTVTSKQIGALPVTSVVCLRKSLWPLMLNEDDAYSYLNLARWRNAAERNESPHTPSIALLGDLRKTLLWGFDRQYLRDSVAEIRALISGGVLPVLPGEGPVATLDVPDDFGKACQLYPSPRGWQLYLWSGGRYDYERLIRKWGAWKRKAASSFSAADTIASPRSISRSNDTTRSASL